MEPSRNESGSHADKIAHGADQYLGKSPQDLTAIEQAVLTHAAGRRALSRDLPAQYEAGLTFGERLADAVARFGGSWPFIALFGVTLAVWVLANQMLAGAAFDPYPFIFLNLMLSMLAAVQAPIIMMSQNRQAERDRIAAAHDYEVNLKAEIEIMALHDKFDQMRNTELRDLLEKQQQQIEMLTRMLAEQKRS